VLELVREKYRGGEGERFGPTLAAEHLSSEVEMRIAAETLRRWMLAQGLWRRRKRKPYRRRHFGELVQMDGSFHDWLQERGPGGCLMSMTDDATSQVELRLGEAETVWAAVNTLGEWIENHGVPQVFYVDWKSPHKRAPTPREQLRGQDPVTQFGRMCEKLGIAIIAAGAPQAKGRVEPAAAGHASGPLDQEHEAEEDSDARAGQRAFTAGLSAGAQPALPGRGSGGPGLSPPGTERGAVAGGVPAESERMISNDWVVCYAKRLFQVQAQSWKYAPAQGQVVVCEWQDGTVEAEYRGPSFLGRRSLARRRECWQRTRQRRCFGLRPALHPKRAAQSAAQGYAPAATRNRTRQEQPNTKAQKGDISNELRKGTL